MIGKDLPALSIADLQSLLRRREVSPREVIEALRERIDAVDRDIGAFLWLDIEAAMKEARARQRRSSSWRYSDCH